MLKNTISCEMCTKVEMKEDNISSQNEKEFLTKDIAIKTDRNTVLLNDDGDMKIKMEIKSEEASLPDLCLQNEGKFFTQHLLTQIESVTVTCRNNTKTDIQEETIVPDFGSQRDPVREIKKYNSDDEIQIKEECWWQQTGTSPICEEIKDEDFPPVKSPRSHIEAVSGDTTVKSSLPSAEDMRKLISLYNGKGSPAPNHSKCQESHVMENHSPEKHIHLKPSGKCAHGQETFSAFSYLKQTNLSHNSRRPHKCEICEKRFTRSSHLKMHSMIHEGSTIATTAGDVVHA